MRMRPMERAPFYTAWREKKLHGVFVTASGASGNAATRVEAFIYSQCATGCTLKGYQTCHRRGCRGPDRARGREERHGLCPIPEGEPASSLRVAAWWRDVRHAARAGLQPTRCDHTACPDGASYGSGD